jgi:hypothetical protein
MWVRTSAVLAMVVSVSAGARQAPNLPAMQGCWRVQNLSRDAALKWTTEVQGRKNAGECPLTVTESWQLCMSTVDEQHISGSATVLEQSKAKPMADPGDGSRCLTLAGLGYDQSFKMTGTAKDRAVDIALTPEKCVFGECPTGARSGSLAVRDPGLVLTFADGKELPLTKAGG